MGDLKAPSLSKREGEEGLIATYKLRNLGTDIHNDPDVQVRIYSDLVALSRALKIGGRLVLDFLGVQLISPVLLTGVFSQMERAATEHGRGFFRGRFLIAKDINPDIRETILSLLKQQQASLLVLYEAEGGTTTTEILNLPPFLSETLKLVQEDGPLTSSQLAELLGKDKGSSARERLRQLYRKGLVTRTAHGTLEGARYFEYEAFSVKRA